MFHWSSSPQEYALPRSDALIKLAPDRQADDVLSKYRQRTWKRQRGQAWSASEGGAGAGAVNVAGNAMASAESVPGSQV
ncbi:hypothetical protein GCM10027569_38920 [Flindersiella endophytica]